VVEPSTISTPNCSGWNSTRLLKLMVEKGASDLFITAGVPPMHEDQRQDLPVTKLDDADQARDIVHRRDERGAAGGVR
jgi:Tfp pilus assembly ATPase PilU